MRRLISLLITFGLMSSLTVSCAGAGGDDSSGYGSLSTGSSFSESISSIVSESSTDNTNSVSTDSASDSSDNSSNESTANSSDSSSDSSSSVVIGETQTIYYLMRLHDHSLLSVMEDFWIPGGRYPSSYVEGIGVTIDDLKDRINVGTYYVEFLGWYLDAACKIPFDGKIDPDETGPITLYAKTKNAPLSTSEDSSGWITEQ